MRRGHCAIRIASILLQHATVVLLFSGGYQSIPRASAYAVPFFGVPGPTRQFRHHQSRQTRNDLLDEVETLQGVEDDDNDDYDDDLRIVEHYTSLAIQERGTPAGLDALYELAKHCQRRLPYKFENCSENDDDDDDSNKRPGTVVAPFPKLLSPSTVETFLDQVQQIEKNEWFGMNPDSVDGLPSLHLNLISGGTPVVTAKSTSDPDNNDFQQALSDLLEVIKPQLYEVLLPEVQRLLNDTSISISEVFLRRYGQDICGGVTRNGISAHYDVFSRVTSVIALDNVAAAGTNGLYTSYISYSAPEDDELSIPSISSSSQSTLSSTRSSTNPVGSTSNHAALRRFFPLKCGDGVVHTWDVLHGVDVEPGLDRTSLIVWFTDGNEDPTVSPAWLTDHPEVESNDVVQFVLGSALSSLEEPPVEKNEESDNESTTTTTTTTEEDMSNNTNNLEHELYLQSAKQGNAFALTRLGSIFEEGSIRSESFRQKAQAFYTELLQKKKEKEEDLPLPISQIPETTDVGMATRCWLEGALKGNPLAQRSLADELMFLASQSEDPDARLLASVLFALAAQQGCAESVESLSRVVDFDLASRGVQTEEEFMASPVVRTAKAALI